MLFTSTHCYSCRPLPIIVTKEMPDNKILDMVNAVVYDVKNKIIRYGSNEEYSKVYAERKHRLIWHVLSAFGLETNSWRKLMPKFYKIGQRDKVEEDYRCHEDSDVHHEYGTSKNGMFHTSIQNHSVNRFISTIESGPPMKNFRYKYYFRCDKCANSSLDGASTCHCSSKKSEEAFVLTLRPNRSMPNGTIEVRFKYDRIRSTYFKSEEECELFKSILQKELKELESKELWNEAHCIDVLVENARDVAKGKTVDTSIMQRCLKLRWHKTALNNFGSIVMRFTYDKERRVTFKSEADSEIFKRILHQELEELESKKLCKDKQSIDKIVKRARDNAKGSSPAK